MASSWSDAECGTPVVNIDGSRVEDVDVDGVIAAADQRCEIGECAGINLINSKADVNGCIAVSRAVEFGEINACAVRDDDAFSACAFGSDFREGIPLESGEFESAAGDSKAFDAIEFCVTEVNTGIGIDGECV